MFVRFALLTALLAAATSPALAQDNTAAAAAPDAKPAAKERKICIADADTGSIMPHRTCHTKAEWTEINKQAQNDGAQFDRHAGGVSN